MYKIIYHEEAKNELKEAYEYIKIDSPYHAEKWKNEFLKKIKILETMPESFPVSLVDTRLKGEVRQFIYGKKQGIYRVLYKIIKQDVYILHIRHGARKPLE